LNRPRVTSLPLYLAAWRFYDRAAGALSIRPRLVPSYRHCFTLWRIYNEEILASARPEERLVTHYDNYFINPVAELRRVLSFLQMDVHEERIEESCSVILPGLRHNRPDARKTSGVRLPPEVADLYSRMCEEAVFVRGVES
jgi:hypothetical protein